MESREISLIDLLLAVNEVLDGDGYVDLGNGITMDLVLIPAGDDPLVRYTLTNDFYMMTTEVTQGMLTELMGYEAHSHSTGYGVGQLTQLVE